MNRMLRWLLLLLLYPVGSPAQNPRCGTDVIAAHKEALDPVLRQARAAEADRWQTWLQNPVAGKTAGAVYRIPVVVHVIQTSSLVRVSDARIQDQITILNEDFRRMMGTNGFGNGVDTEIEFCLARIDPNGCPTTGINRILSPSQAYHDMDLEAQLKALSHWDSYRYLNIWVPERIVGGILGYATFPFWISSNPNLDGVVVASTCFGRGAEVANPTYNLGRTLTHEVGHWLGLFHTFQGGCAGLDPQTCDAQGDWVCDTPPTSGANYGCPDPQNTCPETPADLPDMTDNYMDYTDDRCMNQYSAGQRDRMHSVLTGVRSLLVSAGNLTATGCDGTVSPGCAPTAKFVADQLFPCVGDTVRFTDLSSGPASVWNWNFQGGTPGFAIDATPWAVFSQNGAWDVTLQVSNGFGQSQLVQQDYIVAGNPASLPASESFENTLSAPLYWYTLDHDEQGTWRIAYNIGSAGSACMLMPHYTLNAHGSADALISLPVRLTSLGSAELSFDYAYRQFNAFRHDTLRVLVSTDCGGSWTQVWRKTGADLATVTGYQIATGYVPAAGDWRTVNVDLSAFTGQGKVRVKFETMGIQGQNLYLDQVRFQGTVGRTEAASVPALRAWPTPAAGAVQWEMLLPGSQAVALRLTDLHGRVLWQEEMAGPAGVLRGEIGADVMLALPAGVYLLEAETAGARTTVKLLR